MIHQLSQEDKIEIDNFINHSNTNISKVVTSILMDDEKYALSDWERKNIFVTEPQKILSKLVTDAILNLICVLFFFYVYRSIFILNLNKINKICFLISKK